MRVEYSRHIEARLRLRRIDRELPRRIFEEGSERYLDTETGHRLAVMPTQLYGRNREVVVAYTIEQECATLLTIHPLKEGQKDNRIRTGRWRKM
jgi:hypothetical protein